MLQVATLSSGAPAAPVVAQAEHCGGAPRHATRSVAWVGQGALRRCGAAGLDRVGFRGKLRFVLARSCLPGVVPPDLAGPANVI